MIYNAVGYLFEFGYLSLFENLSLC